MNVVIALNKVYIQLIEGFETFPTDPQEIESIRLKLISEIFPNDLCPLILTRSSNLTNMNANIPIPALELSATFQNLKIHDTKSEFTLNDFLKEIECEEIHQFLTSCGIKQKDDLKYLVDEDLQNIPKIVPIVVQRKMKNICRTLANEEKQFQVKQEREFKDQQEKNLKELKEKELKEIQLKESKDRQMKERESRQLKEKKERVLKPIEMVEFRDIIMKLSRQLTLGDIRKLEFLLDISDVDQTADSLKFLINLENKLIFSEGNYTRFATELEKVNPGLKKQFLDPIVIEPKEEFMDFKNVLFQIGNVLKLGEIQQYYYIINNILGLKYI